MLHKCHPCIFLVIGCLSAYVYYGRGPIPFSAMYANVERVYMRESTCEAVRWLSRDQAAVHPSSVGYPVLDVPEPARDIPYILQGIVS